MAEGQKREIARAEFCKATHTVDDCWIFMEGGEKHYYFYEDGEIYALDNGGEKILLFRDMPEYGEVWVTEQDRATGKYSIWSTWEVYD